MNDINDAGGYAAFALFHTLKLHFTTKYDYLKYNGKCTINQEAFMLRKDKYTFYKLSRRYKLDELRNFYLANLTKNPKMWSNDLLTEVAADNYKEWNKRNQSLAYKFEQDIRYALDRVSRPDELLKVVDGEYPLLYNMFSQHDVSLETIIIMNDFMQFIGMWKMKVEDDIIFPDFVKVVEKYGPFVNYERAKMRDILKKVLEEIHA